MEVENVFLIFYADTPNGELNKLFRWRISSILAWRERLSYFIKKGFLIRSAYLEEKGINQRISEYEIQGIIDDIISSKRR
jgi:hypothetical protein